MTDLRHPGDETLLRHTAGTLGLGASLVVAAHVAGCRQCAGDVAALEAVGGALLEALPSGEVPPEGLARAFAAIERGSVTRSPEVVKPSRPPLPPGFVLPKALDACDFGPWRSLAPGIKDSHAREAWARATNLKLLRVEPGKQLLTHGHRGTEWTCVLTGSFTDGRARFAAGDFCEVDQTVDHQPVVDGDEVCICLIASEGGTLHHGLLGRLHQAIFGD